MVSGSIAELKNKMKIEESTQKMICFGCGQYYLNQLYVRDGEKYFPISEFFCLNCEFQCSIKELGSVNVR